MGSAAPAVRAALTASRLTVPWLMMASRTSASLAAVSPCARDALACRMAQCAESHFLCAMRMSCHTCNAKQADALSQKAAGKLGHVVRALNAATPERSAPQTLLARQPGQLKHCSSMKSARAHLPLASQLQPVVQISSPLSLWHTSLSVIAAMLVPCSLNRGNLDLQHSCWMSPTNELFTTERQCNDADDQHGKVIVSICAFWSDSGTHLSCCLLQCPLGCLPPLLQSPLLLVLARQGSPYNVVDHLPAHQSSTSLTDARAGSAS